MYRMCVLIKPADTPGVVTSMVTWIRSEIAVVGNVLNKLKDNDTGEIRNGWTVASVGDTERAEKYLIAQSRSFTKTRKASDI